MYTLLVILLILDSILLGTVVLLQAGQGGGLAALGGGSSTDSFFGGRQATTILTKMSWWCGGLFLGLSLVLAVMTTQGGAPRSVIEGQIQAPAPVTAPLPLDATPAIPQGGGQATRDSS
jgi:preprotein translocase subunit SecG